jgi:CheY-like chemotaxis protein
VTSTTEQCRGARYILVVDDDDDLRETMELLLSTKGHAVVTAANGAEALESLQVGPTHPCVILLDLMMPVMDGFEMLRRMGADPRLSAVPVVVLTGAGPLADRRQAEVQVEVLRKPVDRQKILSTVERFCPKGEASLGVGA